MLDLHNATGSKKSITLTNVVTSKSFKDILIDSGIIACLSFFSIWSGTLNLEQLFICIKMLGLSFFTQLVYEKGIKKVIQ